ncbi:MAG: Uma2 family endonuclease [Lewinellaceae bacterium]|nr:Uma2 family endonuclease [Saprospiraceae bacterium]MCB9338744.1 Uma2 family endonuclease [Lewinellaceae bacterium]
MLVAEKKITVPEFLQMEFEGEDAYYELINGHIVRKSAPTLQHQETSILLSSKMLNHALTKKLGKVFTAPTDVYLDEFNHVLPDIFFVSNKNSKILDYQEGVVIGVPDLIVEILSPGTMGNDRFDKKKAYENAGVQEYWLVDPNNKAVEVYQNEKGEMALFDFAESGGTVKSKVLEGFELEVKEIFS